MKLKFVVFNMPAYLKKYTYQFAPARLLLLTVCFLLGINGSLRAQKYTFSHFNIEDGLVQSQVNKFSQDKSHYLWIGTLGGACRFDGKDFTSYSKENGLANNFIYNVYCDKKNRTWFGSHMGIACLNGDKLTNYPPPKNVKRTWVTNIVEDNAGTIWLTMDAKLFKVNGPNLQYVPITDTADEVTSIAVNGAGVLYVAFYQYGIYSLQGHKWINSIPIPDAYKKLPINKILFDRFDTHKAYLLSYSKLLVATNGMVSPYLYLNLGADPVSLMSLAQDARGDLWIGSSNGAYYLKNNKLIHFTAKNGLSDVTISDIYCDNDNNIWLATWGDGIYKYEGDSYVVFDQADGIGSLKSIMGIARTKQHDILLAADGTGIIRFDGKDFKPLPLPTTNPNSKRIQCLYSDRDSNIWVGTSLGGLWKYDGKKYQMMPKSEGRITNAIAQDGTGTMWIAAPLGCFYKSNDTLYHLDHLYGFTSSLLPLGRDSMLIGTQYGVRMAVNKQLVTGFKIDAIESSNLLCMMSYHNLILFGTGDRGLFVWDRRRGIVKNYNVKNGFNSNSIYNLLTLANNTIWAGTGRGLNRVIINPVTLECTVLDGGDSKDLVAEANQNSVLYTDGKIWMGTTKGLIIYNHKAESTSTSKPYVIVQSVKLFNQQDNKAQATEANYLLKDGASIPYDQNHIAISFLGVYLKKPGSVSYQYQLTGLDDNFCPPVKNNMVDYPSLPPGKYTFQVKAVTAEGLTSDNIAKFSFEITPPFYQTWLFRVLLLFTFVLIGISLQTYMHKRKLRAVKLIERMKREEKQKIRKQTAEDFHDDLGNKLTRITILSDILSAKMDDEKTDQKKLVNQIKQNAEALYLGTKDILWALDPKSDNLYEILIHIKNFGIELFHDTTIEFEFDNIAPSLANIKLPMEYSRNLTMIYKELLNNVLKHAQANKVNIKLSNLMVNEYVITLTDDGKGFDQQYTIMGHGTNNIKNRAARIGCTLDISSDIGKGTRVTLNLKLKH